MRLHVAIAAVVLVGCSTDPTIPSGPAVMEAVGFATGTPGWRLDEPLTVKVLDAAGQPVQGVVVSWSTEEPGAWLESETSETDADGIAGMPFAPGHALGDQEVRASVLGLGVTISIEATGSRFTSVAFLPNEACGVTPHGGLQCWSLPSYPHSTHPPPAVSAAEHAPTPVDAGQQYRRVYGRGFRGAFEERVPLCGLTTAGTVRCRNDVTSDMQPLPAPVPFTEIARATALDGAICGLASDQVVWCQGDNTYGQLGDGTTTSRTTFAPVHGSLRATSLFGLHDQVCAIDTEGMAWCWGRNDDLFPGGGNLAITVPTRTGGDRSYRALAGVHWGICGIPASAATLHCWGGSGMEGTSDPVSGGTTVAVNGVAEMSGMDDDALFREVGGSLLAAGDHAHSPPLFAFVRTPQTLSHWPNEVTAILSQDGGLYWCVATATGTTLCSSLLNRPLGVPLARP